ncbi:2,4-dihydroxyhept-2-ene-1,7-dioic acid aldolase [Rubrobacter tropicus]|uniref:2,4-dihydroxyhept-2-ene-1,7-dioic acid aldolase n=1 Tax=Rubrobacter tropicus TaxID=2653851 RepID=A0A6G8Q4Z4_9ACTN|nr:aldolase/citrate lyase family protein [Rubrobacter tropicus]QIN81489.1 2,4-dihydroxyhept-2-ene-1,7-dioic acid aldolase [Rubrobacter tropicus]
MRENRVRSIWEGGGVVLNGWLHVPSSFSAEVMAHAGYDSLTIDLQHGPPDMGSVIPMLQAISTTDVVPFARVNWNDPGTIMKLLDAGCYGIICPMIEGREDAEAFVGACRYPPEGYRSYGPFRANLYGGPDYAANANEAVVTVAMIETREALEDLEGILSVPGLDAVFVGPSDLGQALGHGPGMDREEPEVVEAIVRVVGAARDKGLAAGIFTGSTGYAGRMIEAGFNFVNVSSDVRFLADGASAAAAALREKRPPER